jgi:hypothetical protein
MVQISERITGRSQDGRDGKKMGEVQLSGTVFRVCSCEPKIWSLNVLCGSKCGLDRCVNEIELYNCNTRTCWLSLYMNTSFHMSIRRSYIWNYKADVSVPTFAR